MFARTSRSVLASDALTLTLVGTSLAEPHPLQGSRSIRVSDGCSNDNNRGSRWGGGWRIEIPRRDDDRDRRRSLDASCLESCVRIDGQEVIVHLAITRDRRGDVNAKLTLTNEHGCDLDIDAVSLKITGGGESWKQTLEECNSRDHNTTTFKSHDAAPIKSCANLKVSLRIYTESDDVDTATWRDVELR